MMKIFEEDQPRAMWDATYCSLSDMVSFLKCLCPQEQVSYFLEKTKTGHVRIEMSFVVRGSFGEDTLHYIETHNHHIFLPDSSRVQMREKLQEIILTEER